MEINVLLVEDNRGDVILLKEVLKESEDNCYNLICGEDLKTGLALLAQNNIDVILLDLSLPDSKGLNTLFKIMAEDNSKPIIILSGNDDFNMGKNAIQEGAQDYLIKGKYDYNLLSRSIAYAIERKGMELKVQESEKLYRELIELSPNAICIHTDKKIVYVNSAAIKMAGAKDKSELLGRPILSFVHNDYLQKVFERLSDIESGKITELSEEKFIKLDGAIIDVEVIATEINFKNLKAYQVIIKDITEKKKLEEKTKLNEEKYKRLYENSSIGIYHSTLEGKFIDLNKSLANMLGYSSPEEVMASVSDIGTQIYFDSKDREKIIQRVKVNPGWIFEEVPFKRKDGSVMTGKLSIRVENYTDKNDVYAEGFIEDITEKKKAAEILTYQSAINAEMANLAGNLLNAKSLEDITAITLEKAQKLTKSKFGFVGYIDTKTGFLVAPTLSREIWNECQIAEKKIVFEKFNGLWGWSLIHKKSVMTNEPFKDYRSSGTPFGHVPITKLIAVPAMHNHYLVGLIAIANSEVDYNETDLKTIEQLASVYALGIRRIQAVDEVLENQERFRLAFQFSNVGSVIVGLDKRLLKVNSTFSNMLGYTEDEILAKSFDELSYIEDQNIGIEDYYKMLKGELEHTSCHKRYCHKDGHIIWALVTSTILRDQKNNPIYFITHIQDFTKRFEAEEKLKASLNEKEMLIKELFHRTKNNMQVICSMIGLKAATTRDQNIISLFKEMENRIKSMALVHQKLYQSQNLSKIELKDYITDLVSVLYMSYNVSSEKISLELNLENITVIIDTAIPCGLFINELVTNTLKYAFPGNKTGKLKIELKRLENEKIMIGVIDNGIGIQEGVNVESENSLGFQMLRTIAESQLEGEFDLQTKNGVSCSVIFRDSIYSERV